MDFDDNESMDGSGGVVMSTVVTNEDGSVLGPDTAFASMSRDEIAKREEDHGGLRKMSSFSFHSPS
jgi:hypothetical protein